MMHSIIASNRAPSGPDVFASSEAVETLSLSTNLFGTLEDSGIALGGTDLLGVDPMLEPLEDNGGQTPTMALSAESPAADAVPPEDCLD